MENAKKKRIKKYISWGCIALVVVLLAAMPLIAKSEVEKDGPVASVHSGTVAKGNISTALHGGGNLEMDNAEDVTIPAEVKIKEFLVKNGDVVTEGTPLAIVDKVSVMTAITEVTDTMDYLQEQIDSVRDETVSGTVSATAGGRIKQVFAKEGDSVQDVMLEHGALAVLSIDGLMAVKIERNMDLGTGDSVTVTLSDGTKVTGRVESNLIGVIVITVEDEGYEIGEKVNVTTEDGNKVGTGELYVHNEWKATAFTGTISAVYAKEETDISSGSTLFTLKDTEFTAELEYMANLHREYEELMQDLFKMYEEGVITAPCDGMISGVDEDSAHLLCAVPAEWELAPLSNVTRQGEEKGWMIMLLGNETDQQADGPICKEGPDCELLANSDAHKKGCIQACDRNTTCDATVHHLDCIKSCDHGNTDSECDATGSHYKDCIKDCDKATEGESCSASKHYASCVKSCIIADDSADCPAEKGYHYSDCIESCDKTEDCPGTKNHYDACVTYCDDAPTCDAINHKATCPLYGVTYTAYAAKVTSAGTDINVIADYGTIYTVTATENGWSLEPSLNTQKMSTKDTIPSNTVGCKEGDIILIMTGTNAEGKVVVSNRIVVYQKANQSAGMMDPSMMMPNFDLSSLLGGMRGMAGMMPSYGSIAGTTTGPELFNLEGDVLMTVTPQDVVSLTITLDEKDISKVSVGQTAEVAVEAIRGETFEAEVVKVGTSGTNNGGSSKFTAKLELDYAENMLDGMSATAALPLYTKMDVLTIPVEALVEDGAQTVVYTALDEETGEPANPVPVTIGVSDGITAEILSGLQLGDTYYYSYYDILELDTNVEARSFSFGR